ncbi:hypothetical protein HHI36_014852 [Cryptolaemus montrouzieri]|uniref:CCHC-type domain-containing protein n=1 Tax=Cryptolaemus montrouzieri TaxID=559131 RepID=A0ABD2N3X9_9CUCU
MGENVEDKDLSFALMNGVEESYEMLIMMLQQGRKSAPPSEEIKIALIEESNRQKLKGQDESSMVLLSSGYNKKKPWKKQANKGKVIRCYECNAEGHKRPDCPKRKGRSKENTSNEITMKVARAA